MAGFTAVALVLLLTLVANNNSSKAKSFQAKGSTVDIVISPSLLAKSNFSLGLFCIYLHTPLNSHFMPVTLLLRSRFKADYLLLLLVMAGDTGSSINPGPCKFPCGVCSKPVKTNQAAIECEDCLQWYHRKCIHQSTKSYEAFCNNSRLTWICSTCLFPNFSTTFLMSHHDFTSSNDFSILECSAGTDTMQSAFDPLMTSSPDHRRPSKPQSGPRALKSSFISIFCANINSIRGKKLEFQSHLETEKPDVVALQETKIDASVPDNELFPPELGYSIFRNDRTLSGGGVLLAIKSSLDPISPRVNIDTKDSESVWAKLNLQGQAHYFCSYYRPPDQPFGELINLREQLRGICNLHSSEKPPAIHVMGDFNFRNVDWINVTNRSGGELCDSEGLVLVDIIRDFYMEQLITFTTRGDRTLDLLFTNRPGLASDVRSLAKFSDHDAIGCLLLCATTPQRKARRKIYLFSKGDFDQLRSDMRQYSESLLTAAPNAASSVEELWLAFKNALTCSIDKNIPSKFVSGHSSLPWLSPNLRRLIRRKNRLHAKFKKTGSSRLRAKWREVRNNLNNALHKARNDYINGIIGDVKSNPKPFWRLISAQRQDSQAMPPLKTDSGLALSDKEKAATLNLQFCENFSHENTESIPLLQRKFPMMSNIVVTESGVAKLLSGLKSSKSAGPDGLHPTVLKEAGPALAPALAFIFQKSLDTGSVPHDWCVANICPLFKKGDRSTAINYRPISLTSVVCKLLEHIVCSNIMSHVDTYSILTEFQHAFRKFRSCTTQLCHVVNDWAYNIDSGLQTDAFIIDFAKAFDKVPHERLKSKLNSYGISGSTLRWIDSFLCHRKQRVVVNGTASDWANVVSGVPQGTVLGPILFSLFINDIVHAVSPGTVIRLFADDCICYRTIKSLADCDILQRDIDNLASWADTWLMEFAPSKCKTMRVSTKTRNFQPYLYNLRGVPLDSVKEVKYLGVTITHDLRWNKHVADITRRANRILGLLRRNLYFCDKEAKEAAYFGLVRPILEYASSIWDPCSANLINEIEKIQRRAVRFVTSDYQHYEVGTITNHLLKLGWKPLKARRDVTTVSLFNQGLLDLAVLPLADLTTPQRRSRHMHSMFFQVPFARTNRFMYSFVPRAVRLWNALPESVVSTHTNVKGFEALVKSM